MRKLFCIVAVLACVSTAGVVCARTWFLPDYQTGELQKKGYQDRGQGNAQNSVNRTNNFGCGTYNATDQDDVGTQDCESRFRLSNGRWCYLGCCQPCNPSSYTTSQSVMNSIAEPCTDECNGTTYYYPSGCKDDYYKSVASCGDDDTRCVYSISSPDSYGCGSCSYACNSANNYVSSCSTNDTQCKAIFGDQGPCGSLTCGTCTLDCEDGYVTGCTNPTNGSASLINTAKCGSKTCGTCSYSCNTKYYLSGTTCNKCQFTGYPLTDKIADNATDFGTSAECGGAYQYKVTACANGFQPNSAGDGCSDCSCPFTGYPLPTKSATNATDFGTSPACCGNYQYKVTACASGYEVNSDGSGCKASCPTSCDKECGVNSYCNTDSCGCVTFDECKEGYTTDESDCSELEDYGTVFLNHTDKFGCGDCDSYCENRPYTNSCPNGFDCVVEGAGPCYRVNGCADDYYDCSGCCVPTAYLGYDQDCSLVEQDVQSSWEAAQNGWSGTYGCY